jgi:hypothetical protein
MASNNRRACVFCKATDRKIAKEHVWPKWLRKVIESGEGEPQEQSRIHTTRDGETLRHETWTDIPINRQVAAPCKGCNEGWMEGIESETRPILTPMIQHESVNLDPCDQEVLARWATLRVMMAQYMFPPEKHRPIRPERYHRFYEAKELPPKAQVWIARRNGEGPWPTHCVHKELFIATPKSSGPNAYITAFAVGHVAFVYWGHEVKDGATLRIGKGMKPFLLPIWPEIDPIRWPPVGLLGETDIDAVVENLVATS